MKRNQAHAIRAILLALLLALVAGGPALASGSGLSGVVNVNTASAEELSLLPGVGAVKAQAIVETRQARGGFRSVEDLLEVRGIGPAALERIRSHVALEGKTTLTRE